MTCVLIETKKRDRQTCRGKRSECCSAGNQSQPEALANGSSEYGYHEIRKGDLLGRSTALVILEQTILHLDYRASAACGMQLLTQDTTNQALSHCRIKGLEGMYICPFIQRAECQACNHNESQATCAPLRSIAARQRPMLRLCMTNGRSLAIELFALTSCS